MVHLPQPHHPPRGLVRRLAPLLLVPLVTSLLGLAAPAAAAVPVEDYASYDGQTGCAEQVKPGTRQLQAWAVNRFGGRPGPLLRGCTVGGRSEHKDGRAFDWTLDAAREADRQKAWRFISNVLRTRGSTPHAKARRMGIMYIIWNDRIWKSYNRFSRDAYRPCKRLRNCSKTARHRDHVHVSLSRRGARAKTSWYVRRNRDAG